MSPESCSKVSSTAGNHAIYLYDNHEPINLGHVFFLVFHFELAPFSDGQLSETSARPTVFNWENYVSSNLLYQLLD